MVFNLILPLGYESLKMPDRALVSLLWLKDPHPKLGTLV